MTFRNNIFQGHVLEELKKLPAKSVDMAVTSPPYWGLRDYQNDPVFWDEPEEASPENPMGMAEEHSWQGDGFCSVCGAWEGSLGNEPNIPLFIKHLCDIFDETKRVLKDHGTLWVNIGDSYISSGGITKPEHLEGAIVGYTKNGIQRRAGRSDMSDSCAVCGKKAKDLKNFTNRYKGVKFCSKECLNQESNKDRFKHKLGKSSMPNKSLGLIPHRFAIAMVDRGWVCRNTIIWKKNNVLPQSMKDRFTVDFEYLFFFAKKPQYYFDQILEPSRDSESYDGRKPRKVGQMTKYDADNYAMQHAGGYLKGEGKKYPERNKRTVWEINTKSFRDAHFAVFPEELVEIPILAGCPEYVCKECGKPKVKEWEKLDDTQLRASDMDIENSKWENQMNSQVSERHDVRQGYITNRKLIGYKATCKCNADFESGIVLDMFMGSGTTGLVAMKNARDYVGIELSQDYIDIAKRRLDPYINVRLDEFTKLYKSGNE
tara:strand:- start:15038 stop:16495 length:1458 start_codon:yes stop_codon:yes gene_type:complete